MVGKPSIPVFKARYLLIACAAELRQGNHGKPRSFPNFLEMILHAVKSPPIRCLFVIAVLVENILTASTTSEDIDDMHLDEYLETNKIQYGDFAKAIGVSHESVRRYALRSRIPQPPIMDAIVAATGGAVTANDFYGISPPVPLPSLAPSGARSSGYPSASTVSASDRVHRPPPSPACAPPVASRSRSRGDEAERLAVAALDAFDAVDPVYEDSA